MEDQEKNPERRECQDTAPAAAAVPEIRAAFEPFCCGSGCTDCPF